MTAPFSRGPRAALTSREREIARLLVERRTNREIGEALAISPRTVSTHLANVFQKFEIESRKALVELVRADPTLLTSDSSGVHTQVD